MDELNKNQLILLALLVSFVTSIAASIATASLLEQAPPRVTQTIHRVVERTVETVAPSESSNKPAVVTQEKTVIVREEDAITEAIANASPSLVRLYLTTENAEKLAEENKDQQQVSRFRGIAVSNDSSGGVLIVSTRISGEQFNTYEARLADGTVTTAVVQERGVIPNVTRLAVVVPAGAEQPVPALFGEDSSLKLGQTLLGLGGVQTTNVNIGIVSNIIKDENGAVSSVQASFVSDVDGMPLLNLFGEVIGFSAASGSDMFMSTDRVVSGNPTS